ncbi:MAG: hypothetical protein WCT05_16650, partial [Lentisphaeria bacterium]
MTSKSVSLLVLFLSFIANADNATPQGVAPSGTGTNADPYQIDSLPNLLWLSTNNTVWSAGNEFRLMKDIDASDTKNWNSDSGF